MIENNRRSARKRRVINKKKFVFSSFILLAIIIGAVVFAGKLLENSNKKDVDIYNENIAQTSVKQIKEEKPVKNELTLVAGGDLLIHDTVFKAAMTSNTSYDFTPMFSEVKHFFEEADIGIINLEVPVAGNIYAPSNYPNFNSPVELLDAVKDMGIEVVSTANNHALDKGLTGLNETIKNARARELNVVGTYDSEDTKPIIMDKNDIKIGIASYTYGTNGIKIPNSAPYCVNIIDKDKMLSDINYMKEKQVDFIVFCMHFGQEYQLEQNTAQEDLVKFLVENGVDVVFGSHPHVPQPYKIIETTDEEGNIRKSFVIYSLGNFISNQVDYYTKLGGIATVKLSKEGNIKTLESYNVTPIYTYLKTISGKKTFKVVPLEKAIYEYDNKNIDTYSESEITTFKKLFNDTSSIYEKYSVSEEN